MSQYSEDAQRGRAEQVLGAAAAAQESLRSELRGDPHTHAGLHRLPRAHAGHRPVRAAPHAGDVRLDRENLNIIGYIYVFKSFEFWKIYIYIYNRRIDIKTIDGS